MLHSRNPRSSSTKAKLMKRKNWMQNLPLNKKTPSLMLNPLRKKQNSLKVWTNKRKNSIRKGKIALRNSSKRNTSRGKGLKRNSKRLHLKVLGIGLRRSKRLGVCTLSLIWQHLNGTHQLTTTVP